jgi:hypothetical protein
VEAAQLPAVPIRAADFADDAAVGTDAGSAGIDVKASTQSAGRAGQVAQNNGTHFAGQANVRVTVVVIAAPLSKPTVFSNWKTAFRPLPRSSVPLKPM